MLQKDGKIHILDEASYPLAGHVKHAIQKQHLKFGEVLMEVEHYAMPAA